MQSKTFTVENGDTALWMTGTRALTSSLGSQV
jgi:hypothetical protein